MYTSHLYAIRTALIVFPIIAFVFLIPYMIYQYYKYSSVSFLRSFIVYSFIFYFITICFLVMLPLRPRSVVAQMTTPTMDLRFFGFVTDLKELGLLSIKSSQDLFKLISNDRFMEPLLNVALLIPFGVYLRYYFKRTWYETILLSFCLSMSFELTQLSGIFGFYSRPHRLFQVDDLMLNTIGGTLGYVLTPVFVFMFPSRDEIDESSMSKHENVSAIRKGIALLVDWVILIGLGAIAIKIRGLSLNLHVLLKNPLRYIKLLIMNKDVYIGVLILIALFFILIPYLFNGKTIGKALVKIRLKDIDGPDLSFFRLFLRTSLFYSFLNMYYWVLVKFLEYRELNLDMGSFGTFLPITLIVFSLLLILDWIYSKINNTPLLYERVSGVHNVSVYEMYSNNNTEENEADTTTLSY